MNHEIGHDQDLIERAQQGDASARSEILEGYRDYLRRMVAARLDRRLSSRIDASDVVQETLVKANLQFDDFFRRHAIPLAGWLRGLAGERIIDAHRRHLVADRRSVLRESGVPDLPDHSALDIGRQLFATDTSPSNNLMRREQNDRVLAGFAALSDRDREILVMKYLEDLTTAEVAEALGLTESAAQSRHVRALLRLRSKVVTENDA
jgi:RNA polymerase sigma-70 factor, ECF subfamily